MTLHLYRLCVAIAFSLALAPTHAASDRDESKAERADSKAERTEEKAVQEDAQKKRDAPTCDTDSCRRDAQGMHGPERAKFMTECLRKRR